MSNKKELEIFQFYLKLVVFTSSLLLSPSKSMGFRDAKTAQIGRIMLDKTVFPRYYFSRYLLLSYKLQESHHVECIIIKINTFPSTYSPRIPIDYNDKVSDVCGMGFLFLFRFLWKNFSKHVMVLKSYCFTAIVTFTVYTKLYYKFYCIYYMDYYIIFFV